MSEERPRRRRLRRPQRRRLKDAQRARQGPDSRKWQPRERRARSQRQTAVFPKEHVSNGGNAGMDCVRESKNTCQRAARTPDQDGPCLSSLFGGALWIARRESQLKSGPREAVGINSSRQHGSTESRRKWGGGSSINQRSFSRSSRGESIVRVLQRSDAKQSAGDVLIPTCRLNSTMRMAMGCCETVVLGIPKPRTAMGSCVLSGEHAFRRAGGGVRRV